MESQRLIDIISLMTGLRGLVPRTPSVSLSWYYTHHYRIVAERGSRVSVFQPFHCVLPLFGPYDMVSFTFEHQSPEIEHSIVSVFVHVYLKCDFGIFRNVSMPDSWNLASNVHQAPTVQEVNTHAMRVPIRVYRTDSSQCTFLQQLFLRFAE